MTVPNIATRPVSLRASRKVGTNRLFLASSARPAHPHSLTRTRSRAIVSAASSCVIWHTQHVTCARTLTRAPHACHHTSRRYSPPSSLCLPPVPSGSLWFPLVPSGSLWFPLLPSAALCHPCPYHMTSMVGAERSCDVTILSGKNNTQQPAHIMGWADSLLLECGDV